MGNDPNNEERTLVYVVEEVQEVVDVQEEGIVVDSFLDAGKNFADNYCEK